MGWRTEVEATLITRPRPLEAQVGKGGPHHPHHVEQQQFEGPLPGGVVEIAECPAGGAAAVVDQDVQPSEMLNGGADQAVGRARPGYVGRHGDHLGAVR